MCEPACSTQLCSLEIRRKPAECCKHNIFLLRISAQGTVNCGPNNVSVVGQIVFWVFLHQTSLLLWYCGICGHLSSCAVVRCPLSSADQVEGSCCQRRAVTNPWLLWFGLKVGHKTCPGTHMQQFSRGEGLCGPNGVINPFRIPGAQRAE